MKPKQPVKRKDAEARRRKEERLKDFYRRHLGQLQFIK